jgi:hypothetical protein
LPFIFAIKIQKKKCRNRKANAVDSSSLLNSSAYQKYEGQQTISITTNQKRDRKIKNKIEEKKGGANGFNLINAFPWESAQQA